MLVISVSLPAKDLEAFDAVACYENSMLPAESSAPNPCYLPVLHGGIPLATV